MIAYVDRINPDDAHQVRANRIFQSLVERRVRRLVTTSMVVAETATVLSHRVGQSLARMFLEVMRWGNIPVIHIDEALQVALDIFSQQAKHGTSVTDCTNVAVMRRLNISGIFGFDQGYLKRFGMGLTGI